LAEDNESFDPPEERRAHDRSRLIVDVFFDGTDATGVASTKDISIGGLYMNTQATIPEGAHLVVRIPFASGKEIVCTGEIIYSNPGKGVGVRFKHLTDEARALIASQLDNASDG
jgi:PilZ domain